MPELTWPQVVAFVSAFAIAVAAIARLIQQAWAPSLSTESSVQREDKAEKLAREMTVLTEQVRVLQLDVVWLRSRLDKLMDLLIEGPKKESRTND